MYTRRLLLKTNQVPKWGAHFVKSKKVAILEESYVNPMEKVITTYTRNIGYTRVMVSSVVFVVLDKNLACGSN